MCDFNIDLLKDDIDRPTHDYLDLIYSHSLIPTIYKPTRITATTATIIDNILTNAENTVESAILITDLSDHLPTILVSDMNFDVKYKQKNKYVYKRCHTGDNIDRFKQELSKINWKTILNNNNADDDYNAFNKIVIELYDKCIPVKKRSSKYKKDPRSPWITKGILKSINTKNKLYKQYLRCPNNNSCQKFKTFSNKLHSLIRTKLLF
jgi:hypothetical protein